MRWSYRSWRLYCTVYSIILVFSQFNSYSIEKYSLYCPKLLLLESEKIMIEEIGTIETGNNMGEVEKYLKSIGLKGGYSYCVAGQYYCFLIACKRLNLSEKSIPIIKTGLARKVFSNAKKYGKKELANPERHNLIVWRKLGNSWQGHIERVVKKCKAGWIKTVGFNVKNSDGKEGVAYKKRNIYHISGKLQVIGIVGFYWVE